MPDPMVTAVVIICTGALIVAIFLAVRARRQKKERALAEFCQSRGYSYNKVKEPLLTALNIEGDSFSMTSTMLSLRQEAETGSASWEKKTVWTSRVEDAYRPSFVLGSISAAGNWDRMPGWIKKAAVDKLMSESGLHFRAENARPLDTAGKSAFLLFEQASGESGGVIQRLTPLLNGWPAQFSLFIHSSPAEMRIQIAGCFIEDVLVRVFIRTNSETA